MTPLASLPAHASAPSGPPRWRSGFMTLAALGVAWNLFGLLQFMQSLRATPESLMATGLSAAQAAVYLALPGWTTLAFGLGVAGGLIGSVALAMRQRLTLPVLAASMAAYAALFAGDARHGLFEAMPQQLPVLMLVLAVAAALLVGALAARRSGWLR
jgi:hypothetical protein